MTAAPPTTAASNCSWGGNGEKGWDKDREDDPGPQGAGALL